MSKSASARAALGAMVASLALGCGCVFSFDTDYPPPDHDVDGSGSDAGDAAGPDPGDTGAGLTPGSCMEIAQCVESVAVADGDGVRREAAVAACIEAGTPQAQAVFGLLAACRTQRCGRARPEQEYICSLTQCYTELLACDGGSATCAETVACLSLCPTEACAAACLDRAQDLAARYTAVALWDCGADACAAAETSEAFVACLLEACPEVASVCP